LKKTAFLFPGQGAQSVGMASEFYHEYESVREIFHLAEAATGLNLSRLCFEGPIDALTQTVNLQPAVTVVNLACLAVVLEQTGAGFEYAAGHSLGEYSALCAAGVITKQDAMTLVMKRGELMHRASEARPGVMHALMGLSAEAVEDLVQAVRETGRTGHDADVSVANHNTDTQVVITGTPHMVEQVSAKAVEKGAKSRPLKVSGAWHSTLMHQAQVEFSEYLKTIPFSAAEKPVVLNVTAAPASSPEEIEAVMATQLCSKVRWYDAMRCLLAAGVDTFVEIGPGRVLSNLIKRIKDKDSACEIYNISDLKSLDKFRAALAP
jgi:[acyl-carrier-protein] S-malonyltransferase